MKFTVDKSSFLSVLDRCKSATDSKGAMPILSHVLLKADPDTLHGCVWVSGTDLFIGVTTKVSASVDDEGSIALPARDLYDRVKLMPDGDVNFIVDGSSVTLKAKGSPRKFKLQGIPGDEFPTMPKCSDTPLAELELEASAIAAGLEESIYAASTDFTRPHLNAVLLEHSDGAVAFVATDGHRLAIHRSGSLSNVSQLIIPLRAAKEILKLCQEAANSKVDAFRTVHLYPDGANLFVSVNDFIFSCKLVDGSFPPYQQIIPDTTKKSVEIDRRILINALKATSITAGGNYGIKFTFNEGKLTLTAESSKGTGSDEIDCDWSGEEKIYGFNAHYMIESLSSMESDFVSLGLSDEFDPAIITPKDSKEQLAIVMPMRA
jgi:DNA polymerase-3 subunit beta